MKIGGIVYWVSENEKFSMYRGWYSATESYRGMVISFDEDTVIVVGEGRTIYALHRKETKWVNPLGQRVTL